MKYKKIAFIFPGQGSQYIGMGQDFYDSFLSAKEVFEESDDILDRSLRRSIFEGSQESLIPTFTSQPAIYVVSMAILAVINNNFPALQPSVCAGLSLGEYSALSATGLADFSETLKLVQRRGAYMDEVCNKLSGQMAAIIGITEDRVEEVVNSLSLKDDLWIANYNSPGQIVISGTSKGVEIGCEALKRAGAKRAVILPVQGAFHSGLMSEVENRLNDYIQDLELRESNVAFVMNVTGDYAEEKSLIKDNLVKQVTGSVRWQQGIKLMDRDDVDLFIEIGCGRTLTNFNKRIGVKGRTISIEKVQDLDLLNEVL